MSRRSAHTSPRTSSKSSSSRAPVELVTYRFGGDMVYVNPGPDYDQAISCAQENFPSLDTVPRERIAFYVKVRVSGTLRNVRIARNAWSKVLTSLSTYEIIDVSVLPQSSLRPAKSDTDVRTSNFDNAYMLDTPPVYGEHNTENRSSCAFESTDSEKSPFLQIPTLASGPIKRASSALGWFGKHI